MADVNDKAPVVPGVCYGDPIRALRWLETAFGFEPRIVVTDADGGLIHAELGYGESAIGVSGRWSPDHAAPGDVGGRNTQSVHVQLLEDVDAHFDRAVAAGVQVLLPPTDQPYGDRNYICKDLEGHVWSFGQTVRQVDTETYSRASGNKVRTGPAGAEILSGRLA